MANIPLPPKVNIGQVVKKKDIASLVAYGQYRLAFPDYYNNLKAPSYSATLIYSSAYDIAYVNILVSTADTVINPPGLICLLSKNVDMIMPYQFILTATNLQVEINFIMKMSESLYLYVNWGGGHPTADANVIVRAIKYDESLF